MRRGANSQGEGFVHLRVNHPLLQAFSTAFTAPGYDHTWAERQFAAAHNANKTGALHEIPMPDRFNSSIPREDRERGMAEWAHRVSQETGLPHPDDVHHDDPDEQNSRRGDARRDLHQTWQNGMCRALTHGRVTIDQAEERGYSGDSREHGEKGWGDEPRRGGWRPMPQKLYHVGTDADAIAREGLKTRYEQGNVTRGLGGGTEHTVSVTSDPSLGPDIYHALHEHHAVIRGDIPVSALHDYAKNPPVGEPFYDRMKSAVGERTMGERIREVRTHQGMTKDNESPDEHPGWKVTDHVNGTNIPYMWERPMTDHEKIYSRSESYKAFSHVRASAGGHRDPLFISNDPHAFAKADPAKFGIVHLQTHPGAQGYTHSTTGEHHSGADSGEWRTGSGSPFDVEKVDKPRPRHLDEFGLGNKTAAWDRSGENGPVWVQPHDELVRDALYSWRGDPVDMHREVGAVGRGEPLPSDSGGNHRINRARAEVLHRVIQSGRTPEKPLYRGAVDSGLHPIVPTSWSESRKVAEHWAGVTGGEVHELPPGTGRGVRMADHIDDPERQWLIVAGQHREAVLSPQTLYVAPEGPQHPLCAAHAVADQVTMPPFLRAVGPGPCPQCSKTGAELGPGPEQEQDDRHEHLAGKGKPRHRSGDAPDVEEGAGQARQDAAEQVGADRPGPGSPRHAPPQLALAEHPKVAKDLSRLPKPVRGAYDDRLDTLRSGDTHSSTHPLTGPLRGWQGTSLNFQYRMIHRTVGNVVQVASVGNHDESYNTAIRRQAALSDEDRVSVAEQAMERGGHAGRTFAVPASKDDWQADREHPAARYLHEALIGHGHPEADARRIRVYPDRWNLRDGGQATTDGYNTVGTHDQVNELTLLHEGAHILTRTPEGSAGHGPAFQQAAHSLYHQHLGPEAAETFHDLVERPQHREASADDDYRMQHRPGGPSDEEEQTAAPAHQVDKVFPDYYQRPKLYDAHGQGGLFGGPKVFAETDRTLQRVRGNPEAPITMYRALPPEHAHKGIRTGDWVSIHPDYARGHGLHHTDEKEDWPVIKATVPAKHLWNNGDTIDEFGYHGPDVKADLHFPGGENAAKRVHMPPKQAITEHWPPYLTERADEYGDEYPVNVSRSNPRGPVGTEEDAQQAGLVGPYFHGTSKRRARDIRRGGFRQPRMHNWDMADAGTSEEVDFGHTHRTFFAEKHEDALHFARSAHGDDADVVTAYIHPDHIEHDKGGGWMPSKTVKDVAHVMAITNRKQAGAAGPDYTDTVFSHEDNGPHSIIRAHAPDGEIRGALMHRAHPAGSHYGTDGPYREVEMMHTEPAHRRRGVANSLMGELERTHPGEVLEHDRSDEGRAWAHSYFGNDAIEDLTRDGQSLPHTAAQQVLYHGSTHKFEKGTVLTPTARDSDGSIHSSDWVYATTSPESARYFASMHDASPQTDSPVHIHRVVPVGDIEPEHMPGEREEFAHGNYRAKALRVIDHHQMPSHYAARFTITSSLPTGYSMHVREDPKTERWGLPAIHVDVHHNGGKRPVGSLSVHQRDLDVGRVGHPNIYVNEEHQRKGLATAMYAEVHRHWPDIPVEHSEDASDQARELNKSLRQTFGPDLHRTAARVTPHDRVFGPTFGLDHRLWLDDKLREPIRADIIERWRNFAAGHGYLDWAHWVKIVFFGSEASEWTSVTLEGNGDFDLSIGIEYDRFRAANQAYAAMGDIEIANLLTQQMYTELNDPEHTFPDTEGSYDNTWFANQFGWDIARIRPYAAYDVIAQAWIVKPPHLPTWSLNDLPKPFVTILRAAETTARNTLKLPEPDRTLQAARLYEMWHADRTNAFGDQGEGWFDLGNLREKWLDQLGLWGPLAIAHHRAGTVLLDHWSNTPSYLTVHASTSVRYVRNNSGLRGTPGYGQDVEPWGRYMSEHSGHVPEGWESGSVDFDNPLHVEHEDGRWKHTLSEQHGGLVGQNLSAALREQGHDAVITHDRYERPNGQVHHSIGEIVDLRPRERRTHVPDRVG